MDAATNSPTPTLIGDFQIVREIGRGGMGVVYEAVQTSLGRKVALKILSTGLGLTPQAVQRFQREAESAARLHHTNIVPIYATGAANGVHFYAMELIEGPSLDHVIRELRGAEKGEPPTETPVPADDPALTAAYEPAPRDSGSGSAVWTSSSLSSGSQYFDTVARLVAEVADALDYAHRHNVVHRDIKPANLLVAPEGRWSLNDFGLARVLEQPSMTATGEILGTPAYMSPEQIAAGRTPLDHRTDIYSLGATLYELLTLRPPFDGERRDQVLAQIMHKEPRPLRSINKKVPVDLETICLKAMEKDPDRRYQSAGAMAEDLRRHVNRFAISARRVGPVGKTAKWVRRHPGVTTGIGFGCIAIIVAAFFASRAVEAEQRRLAEREQSQKQLATLEREHALENALVAATSGDLQAAEQAIASAERLGATPGQVRMLRGQVAYFQGDYEQATVNLDEAVLLEPHSATAHGLAALTTLKVGDMEGYLQHLRDLDALPLNSVQDELFRGYAEYWTRPRKAMEIIDQAVMKSRSPLARAMRADVACALADLESDIRIIEAAANDIRFAQEYLADNLYVLSVSLNVRLKAYQLYGESNQTSKQAEELLGIETDAKSLTLHQNLPLASRALVNYARHFGNEPKLLEYARSWAEKSTGPSAAHHYAIALYRAGRLEEAAEVLAKENGVRLDGGWFRAVVLAELGHNDIGELLKPLELFLSERKPTSHMLSPEQGCRHALVTFGKREEAAKAYAKVLGSVQPTDYFEPMEEPVMKYGAEQLSDRELISVCKDLGRWAKCEAHLAVGLSRLSKGDRKAALEHLKRLESFAVYDDVLFEVGCAFIKRLEEDSTWPGWIPVVPETSPRDAGNEGSDRQR